MTDHPIKSGAPSLVTTVLLSDRTWTTHIKIDHADVPYQAIIEAVEDPCLVAASKTIPGDYVFVNTFAYNEHGHELRVPIFSHGDGTGRVKTAYFAAANSHGVVIWRRGDDG